MIICRTAFGGLLLWPILGIIFLPFTTLLYVLLWTPGIGIGPLGWLWLLLAVLSDFGGWGSTGHANRDRYVRMWI